MILIATFKPIGCDPVVGEIHHIRVKAASKTDAATAAHYAAHFEGCKSYAITEINEEKQ